MGKHEAPPHFTKRTWRRISQTFSSKEILSSAIKRVNRRRIEDIGVVAPLKGAALFFAESAHIDTESPAALRDRLQQLLIQQQVRGEQLEGEELKGLSIEIAILR